MSEGKVRIRLQSKNKKDLERIRKKFLKDHPQIIMSHPRQGPYEGNIGSRNWSCYGDYWIGHIRRRRNQ